MSGHQRAAQAIGRRIERHVGQVRRQRQLAEVRSVSPLQLAPLDLDYSLNEGEVILSQGVAAYHADVGIATGDNVVVDYINGGWVVTDVVSENTPSTGIGTVADGSITTAKIADDSVTSAKIATDAVGSSEVAANAIGTAELADDSVTAAKIATNAVSTSELADDSVTAAKIATNAVGSSEIAANAVGSSEVAADAITADKIIASAVGSSELATDAVTTAKILNGAVTAPKLAAGTVTKTNASESLSGADFGLLVVMDRSTDQTLTIDGNLDLSPGQTIDIIQVGLGQVTVQGSGATVNGTPGLKFRARYSAASVVCVGTDSYVLVGDLST